MWGHKDWDKKRKTEKICDKLSLDQRWILWSEDNQLAPSCIMFLSPTASSQFGLAVSAQFHRPQWPPQQHRNTFRINKQWSKKVSCRGKEKDARRGEEWGFDVLITWGGWLTGVSKSLGLGVVDGQGVRHWLQLRLACSVSLHKIHAWRRVQSSSVWFWGKEHSL